MTTPTFSILMPVFNASELVAKALDCLIAQTDGDWECIAIDDGSTDRTPEILSKYTSEDGRIKAYVQKNMGANAACKRALEKAAGKWICLLAADDLFEKDKLAIHKQWFFMFPDCRFFYTHFKWLVKGHILESPYLAPIPDRKYQVINTLASNIIHATGVCISSDALKSVGAFDDGYPFNADYDQWLRLLAEYPAVFIPERTCITRMHDDSFGSRNRDLCFYDAARSGIRYLNSHHFAQIFRLMDLDDPLQAKDAVMAALSVAGNPRACIYGMGPHQGMILRILEWAYAERPSAVAGAIRPIIRAFSEGKALEFEGTSMGYLFQSVAEAVAGKNPRFAYEAVDAITIGNLFCEKESLKKYLQKLLA
jgi:glycosyltransferase involved in cell wall biosynthesis